MEYKNGYRNGFSDKYHVKTLVWFEHHEDVDEAISREKRIKLWRRTWKLKLIEADNLDWIDLYPDLNAA